jgi:exopolyphosphatase / guanosine-5'-triphosphate,3'-diphosphate pyrophosphatase
MAVMTTGDTILGERPEQKAERKPEQSGGPDIIVPKLVGVVDLGSNSVRLVIYDTSDRGIVPVLNDRVSAGLGRQLVRTGRLDPQGCTLALQALTRFAHILRARHVSEVVVAATAAMRSAEDGAEFAQNAALALGFPIRIIEGTEEARLSALGVIAGEPRASGIVVDLGGSSLELAHIHAGKVRGGVSGGLGVFALNAENDGALAPEIGQTLDRMHAEIGVQDRPLYLVGGTWRNLARVDMALRDYRLQILHSYRMSAARLAETLVQIRSSSITELAKLPGVSRRRASSLAASAQLLELLCARFCPPYVEVSSFGLREGLVYQRLIEQNAPADPTVSGFRAMARRAGADPSFRAVLADQLEDLSALWLPPQWGNQRARFAECAACLAEVAARQQPDYRAQSAFLLALASSAVGLTHEERLFFAFAAGRRHQRRALVEHADLAQLLPPDILKAARKLGALLRFSCEASGRAPDSLPEITFDGGSGALFVDGEASLGELPAKRLLQLRDELSGSEASFK